MQLIEIPEQTPSSEVDEEILEIFIEEVGEVLEEIVIHFKAWKNDPTDLEALKSLRRSFHTLKGSGRLVGATVIGELGWRFENMLNKVIDGILSRNDDILWLLEQVEQVLPSMIEQFQHNQPTPHQVLLLISQADYLTRAPDHRLGELRSAVEMASASTSKSPTKSATDSTSKTKISHSAMEESSEIDPVGINGQLDQEPLELEVNDFLEAKLESETEDSLAETEFEFQLDDQSNNELGFNPENFVENENELELDIDFSPDELELDAENMSGGVELDVDDLTEQDILSITETETQDSEALDPLVFDIFKKEAYQHLDHLKNYLAKIVKNLPAFLDQEVVRVFHTLNGSSRSFDLPVISEIAAPIECYARALFEQQVPVNSDMLTFFNEATQLIDRLLNGQTIDEEQKQFLLNKVQMSLDVLPSLADKPSKPAEPTTTPPPSPPPAEEIPEATDEFMVIFLEEANDILENTQSLLERWQASPNNMQLMKDLQRELHTLKGGARMVGITSMGDLSHHLESVLTKIVEGTAQSNLKLQEIVQNSVDELAAMLEAVRAGVPLEIPTDLIEQIKNALMLKGEEDSSPPAAATSKKPAAPAAKTSPPSSVAVQKPKEEPEPNKLDKLLEKESDLADSAEDRIRVRVTLIDKLTNLAGELSISRAHMEQQQGSIKNNLVEMEQTVVRLRDQLRRLEIETEAQILSHFGGSRAESDDEEFDPLELDRFSAMQQLSRSLMETVTDLLNIQDFLKTLARQSESLLIQQTRIGAELQDNIMRTRMIPFARISPRLQRIARLTARDLHKQVDFIINGENIEFERTVLNRVVAPLEHMLRNAIGHGVEDAQTRQKASKSSVAKITIDLSREGTELIIKLCDDGAGLNLPAIRKKAEERGLIKPDTVISDYELMQFILEPAFSTATTITQISGRGVGMDVANSEIKQLGGSLRIYSQMGEGTTFEIRLPLSLTINQALMVYVGEETMAIPMNHVDAVMRAPRAEVIAESDEVRYYQYMGNNYRVFHLGELLGFGKTASVDTPLIPTLLVRAADRRVALLVDGIEGNKEIVVKSVGAQIGAIRWIAGATILGDGRVVLILDVPNLTRVDTSSQYVPPQVTEEVVEEQPVAKTIMVVDDSITVRKVTARLLKRQGMEVLTAKDGVDAVAQLQEHIPDLMLLDVEMPRMDGYELATQVRNNPDWKHIPIIMITSRTGAKHRDRAEKIGINRYLGKPFNETELLENITTLLAEVTPRLH